MSRQKRAETPLAHVIDDLRREPSPSIDWDMLEDELMVKVGTAARLPAKRASLGGWARWSFAIAACALGTVAVFLSRQPSPEVTTSPASSLPAEHASVTRLDGHTLAAGAIVTASTSPLVVNHEGHVTWTLEVGSTARVESAGQIVTLALEGGAVTAKVVKSLRPETFVIRVENTRVAVHGTEFRVERVAQGVRVAVSEGVLGIGPVGGPAFELRAPGAATLNLHGVRTDQPKASTAPAPRHPAGVEPSRTPGAAVAASPATNAPAASAPPPAEPAVTQKPATAPEGSAPIVELASKAVQRCFGAHALARGDLHVSVMMKMALRVTNDGRVGDALFDPPLAPGVRECVDREIGALRFPDSPEGFTAARRLELTY